MTDRAPTKYYFRGRCRSCGFKVEFREHFHALEKFERLGCFDCNVMDQCLHWGPPRSEGEVPSSGEWRCWECHNED